MVKQKKLRRVLMLEPAALNAKVRAGVFAYAREAGWVVTPSGSYQMFQRETFGNLARRWNAEGILVTCELQESMARAWRRSPVPVVGASWYHHVTHMPRVRLDFEAVGRAGAEHLLARGYKHLAYCWLGDMPVLNDELAGFREAVEAAGQSFHCLDWTARKARYTGLTSDHFRRWFAAEVAALPKPVGVMVDSDWTGLEAIEACAEANLLVPEVVALLCCFNDEVVCEGSPVSLSSVDPDLYRLGYEGARMLDGLMGGTPPQDAPVLISPVGVVTRQSTDIMAVPHMEVAKALRFITINYDNPRLGVADIVAATTLSRPGLNLAFRRHLGRAIGEQLQKTRLEQAGRMLLETAMTVKAVAIACGYGSGKRLSRHVEAVTGLSPRAWRRQGGRRPSAAE